MTLLSPTALEEYQQAKKRLYECHQALKLANEHMREVVNRHNINHEPNWPDNARIDNIGRNGNNGDHYEQK